MLNRKRSKNAGKLINVLVVFSWLFEDNQQSNFGNFLSQFDELLSVQFVGMCTVQTQFISLYYLVAGRCMTQVEVTNFSDKSSPRRKKENKIRHVNFNPSTFSRILLTDFLISYVLKSLDCGLKLCWKCNIQEKIRSFQNFNEICDIHIWYLVKLRIGKY